MAETIKLCDIADALGRGFALADKDIHEACGFSPAAGRMGHRGGCGYSSHTGKRENDFCDRWNRRGDCRLDAGDSFEPSGRWRKRLIPCYCLLLKLFSLSF